MSETPTNDKPVKDFNKIDLAQLQSFSFGTQWSHDKADPAGNSGGGGGPREPRRDDRPRRDGPSAGAPRDRRGFRKPAGPEGDAPTAAPGSAGPVPREQREGGGGYDSRGPRRDGPASGGAPRGDFRGGQGQGGPHREGAPRFGGPREGGFAPREQGPYVSPYFNVTFYPDDTGFSALAKAIRASCRTYELFEIARVIIGKNDRFIAVVQHKPSEGSPDAKPAPFAISVPDGIPFESEAAALSHVFEKHFSTFFDTAEVEIDAPKGNFQVVNRCTVTGELLGPPNYHRYSQIVQQHHAANIKLPFEVYRGKIESVREPEAIAQWLEKMKKATRYTRKLTSTAVVAVVAPAADAPVAEPAEGEVAAPEAVVAPAPEAAPTTSFDSLEDAHNYLLATTKEKLVRTVESVRFSGKNLETLPQGELRRTIEGALERQRRFPLDTANALRGRLRREGFTIFKKGSKGISYVCAVKRKFRVPSQTFSDSIGALIAFIEKNPMIKASDLADKFLGYSAPAKPAAPVEGAAPADAPAPAAPALSVEQMAKLNRLNGDLRWLVSEGYVTEFIDGRLFAPAPVIESRKKEIEGAEHDPENFPEVPAAEVSSAAEPAEEPAS